MTTLPPHIANAETPRTDEISRLWANYDIEEGKAAPPTYRQHSRQLERENLYLREGLEKMATAIQKRKQFGAQLEGSNASREAQQLIFEALTGYEQLKKDLGL